jgi:molybdate transport system substrate-binding protein
MNMRSFRAAATIGFPLLVAQGVTAEAAEVKVIAGVGMRPVLEELAPKFERATGHKLTIWYGITSTIPQRIETGEAFDLLVSGRVDEYSKQGKIACPCPEIARVGVGVGARAGTPKPDISSVDAFKRAMLDAKSVAYVPQGSVGIHVAKVFERLGIAEQMKAKNRLQDGQRAILPALANGEAELGFVFTNSFSGGGVQLVGPLPPELQRYSVFAAGAATAAKQPEAAKALVDFLTSPAAAAAIKAKGMEPAAP